MAKLQIRLKRNTEEPLKAQVVRQISEFIKSGKLKPGAALPSTHSLGEQLGISRETVRRAYVQLREAKLIEREEKLGYQVQGSNAPGGQNAPGNESASALKSDSVPRDIKSIGGAAHLASNAWPARSHRGS